MNILKYLSNMITILKNRALLMLGHRRHPYGMTLSFHKNSGFIPKDKFTLFCNFHFFSINHVFFSRISQMLTLFRKYLHSHMNSYQLLCKQIQQYGRQMLMSFCHPSWLQCCTRSTFFERVLVRIFLNSPSWYTYFQFSCQNLGVLMCRHLVEYLFDLALFAKHSPPVMLKVVSLFLQITHRLCFYTDCFKIHYLLENGIVNHKFTPEYLVRILHFRL